MTVIARKPLQWIDMATQSIIKKCKICGKGFKTFIDIACLLPQEHHVEKEVWTIAQIKHNKYQNIPKLDEESSLN